MAPVSLAQLRARIAAQEGGGRDDGVRPLSFGLAEIDRILPWGGLPRGGLHEIVPAPLADGIEHGAALGFAAWWLGRLAAFEGLGGPVLWVTAGDGLYAPGLATLGLAAERLLMVRADGAKQSLWAMEQGLHCRGLGGVLGEVRGLDPTAARRLQLAARTSGVTALLLNRGDACGPALTRWRVGPAAGAGPAGEGVGRWRWWVELIRCRGKGTGENGIVAAWLLEWDDEAHRLALVDGRDQSSASLPSKWTASQTVGVAGSVRSTR